ncbi:hypothetical protein HMI55_002625, partial [Coelomomyces lativittatus]
QVDVSKIGLKDLREQVAIIPQEPVLFVGTIRSNLDPFNKSTDEEVWKALSSVHLATKIKEMPLKLDTLVIENGKNFSLGQRQLFCIARAILSKTKILVLDEATAAIDMQTDALIQNAIKENFAELTVLTIAHRLNTIIESDRILVMEAGQVVEFDTPLTLLNKGPKPLFGFSASRPAIFKKADPHVFYLDDEELDFDKVLSAPLPKLPLDVCLTAHWLAIEGVQPSIPQNPVPPTLQEEKKSLAAILNVNVPSSNSTSVPFSAGGTSVNGTYNNGSTLSTTSGTPGNTLQVKDVISKELQLYYEKITEAILNPEIEIRDVALTSIQTDPGLQGLLPYFLKFVQERVTKNLKHLPTLMLMITFLKHLLSNPHFFFEPYVVYMFFLFFLF